MNTLKISHADIDDAIGVLDGTGPWRLDLVATFVDDGAFERPCMAYVQGVADAASVMRALEEMMCASHIHTDRSGPEAHIMRLLDETGDECVTVVYNEGAVGL